MEATLASIHAHNRDIVEGQTWGHLAPQMGVRYDGSVVFACGSYSGTNAFLSIQFNTKDGVELQDNPWSFEDITDYIGDWICDQANGFRDRKSIPEDQRVETDGKVFRFTGHYTRFKNNTSRINGTFKQLTIS